MTDPAQHKTLSSLGKTLPDTTLHKIFSLGKLIGTNPQHFLSSWTRRTYCYAWLGLTVFFHELQDVSYTGCLWHLCVFLFRPSNTHFSFLLATRMWLLILKMRNLSTVHGFFESSSVNVPNPVCTPKALQ